MLDNLLIQRATEKSREKEFIKKEKRLHEKFNKLSKNLTKISRYQPC